MRYLDRNNPKHCKGKGAATAAAATGRAAAAVAAVTAAKGWAAAAEGLAVGTHSIHCCALSRIRQKQGQGSSLQ